MVVRKACECLLDDSGNVVAVLLPAGEVLLWSVVAGKWKMGTADKPLAPSERRIMDIAMPEVAEAVYAHISPPAPGSRTEAEATAPKGRGKR